jgi:spermidine synthase
MQMEREERLRDERIRTVSIDNIAIEASLKRFRAATNQEDDERFALHIATSEGYEEVVETPFNHGAAFD